MGILWEIFWIFAALIITFLFFGGVSSIVIACIASSIKRNPRLALVLGFILSGGVSFWSCRYAIGWVKLSFLDTTIAEIVSLATYIIAIRLLRKYPLPRIVIGLH